MSADPSRGVYFPSIIVEITPEEFERLLRGELRLPHQWRVADELHPSPAETTP